MIKPVLILFMGIILFGMINQESFASGAIVISESNDNLIWMLLVLAIASLAALHIWNKRR